MSSEDVRLHKIVLTGDGAVGKTSIRRRYLGEGFSREYIETMGADFALYETGIGDVTFRWQIWDLAGQPTFSDVVKTYYKGCSGAVVVFDVSRRETYESVKKWVADIWETTKDDQLPIVLVGNKTDLREKLPNTLNTEETQNMAEELKILWIETSALSGEKIEEAFTMLGESILEISDSRAKKS